MHGPVGVVTVVLYETALGGLGLLWLAPLWGVVRPGFFKLAGATVLVCAALAWLAGRGELAAAGATGRMAALWLGVFTAAILAWQVLLYARMAAARWILDPIDGTKNYLRGIPVWATLIALERDGRVELGVVSAPALHRRWWAARGEGAFVNGRRIHVSQVAELSDAVLSYASLTSWEEHGLGEQILSLARGCWRTRAFGDFWSHMLVAEGAVDVAVEPEVSLWDLAALQVIVEEAGGRFTDLGGTPTAAGGSSVSTNGLLHDRVLSTLRR